MFVSEPNSLGSPISDPVPRDVQQAAQQLESAFLAEMLKSAGLGEARSSFGGGAGETQFNSFLIRAQADAISQSGGLGLSEMFIKSLMEARNDGS